MTKNKTFIIVRDVVTQNTSKEFLEIEAKSLAEAINIIRIIPEREAG